MLCGRSCCPSGSRDRKASFRHKISSHDAMYVVLAEALGCKVLTFDARLAKASDRCVTPG